MAEIFPSLNGATYQLPLTARQVLAANMQDASTVEGAALNNTIVASTVPAFVGKAVGPSSRLSPLPGTLDNRRFNNSMSQAQDSVVTVGGVQYAVWSDSNRHPTVGRRVLPGGAWTTYDLTNGPAFINAVTALDEHDAYSLGVDSAGYIHVSGGMHGDWLRYAVSTNPGDITAWTAGAMIGTAGAPDTATERSVSYPRFFIHADGTLFFTYRNGASGLGDQYMNRYDTTSKTWTRIGKLLDGITYNEGPYIDHVVCDTAGIIHVSYEWRPNGGGTLDTNDLCYIRSADKGATWTSIDGTGLGALPITHASSPKALATVSTGSGLNNSSGLGVDTQGRVHIANLYYDGSSIWQYMHVWHDGTGWHNELVTSFVTAPAFLPRPAVVCPANGRTYIVGHSFYDGWRGTLRMIDVTPGGVRNDFAIYDGDLRSSEVTFDSRALRDDNDLHMLITPASDTSPALLPEYWADDNWATQYGAVLTIDLDQISLLQSGVAQRAKIRSVATVAAVPDQTAITATAVAVVPASLGANTTPDMRGKKAVARLIVKAVVGATGTTLTVQTRTLQQDGGGGLVYGSTLTFTSASAATKATPWIPLPKGPINGFDAQLQVFAFKTGASTATIYSATIEYGYLAGPTD